MALDEFKKALGGDTAVDIGRPGALSVTEVLATRSWYELERNLISRGGRPSNPGWTIKRQIPMSPATWGRLSELAARRSGDGYKFAPAHVAAFLLEDALARLDRRDAMAQPSRTGFTYDATNQKFAQWRPPAVFSGSTAA